jgi:hypothetical protein
MKDRTPGDMETATVPCGTKDRKPCDRRRASSKKDGGGAGWLPWLIIQFSLILFHSCWIKFCLLKVSRNMNTLHLNCIPEQFMDANVGKQNCPAKSELLMDSVLYSLLYFTTILASILPGKKIGKRRKGVKYLCYEVIW